MTVAPSAERMGSKVCLLVGWSVVSMEMTKVVSKVVSRVRMMVAPRVPWRAERKALS